jgi:hypothetical protein
MEGYVDILGTREQWSDIGKPKRSVFNSSIYYFLLELSNSCTVISFFLNFG